MRSTSKHFGRTVPCLLLHSTLNDTTSSHSSTPNIFIIGDSTTSVTATQFGIPFSHHIAPLLSNPRSAKRQLISRIHALNHQPTKIICWSDELLPLASTAASRFGLPLELVSTNPTVLGKVIANIDTVKAFDESDHDFWTHHRHTSSTDRHLSRLRIGPIRALPNGQRRVSCDRVDCLTVIAKEDAADGRAMARQARRRVPW